MLIFLYGKDTYRSQEKLNFYIQKFKEKRDGQGLSIDKLEGVTLAPDEFRKNVFSVGLFSQKRMLVIKNLLAENKNQDTLKEIIESFKKLEKEENVVIFYENDEPQKNEVIKKLFNLLTKQKYAEKFDFLEKKDLEKWINNYIKKINGQIEHEAINFLTDYFNADLWSIKNELDKALSYGNGKITLKNLELLCEQEKEENIFALIDALIAKNKKRAVELLEKELAKGTFFPQIIGSLAYQFRIILQVKSTSSSNFYQLAKELGVHPFSVKKAIEQGKKYNDEELKKIYQEILNIDLQLKTSSRDPELLFDLLIAKL